MKKNILILLLLFAFQSYAQVATLYAGLNGVMGKKGDIDVALLTQIITDKQQELKKEFTRRTLLNNVDKGSYAFYSFAENSFDVLFNTTNKTVASRKLMEASANLALAYGFAEFYLQASRKLLRNSDLAEVFMLADTNTAISSIEQKKWQLYLSTIKNNTITYYGLSKIENLSYADIENTTIKANTILDTSTMITLISALNNDTIYTNILKNKPDLITNLYNQYNKIAPKFSASNYLLDNLKPINNSNNKKEIENSYSLNFILVDMVYDILLKSEQINSLGFFANDASINNVLYHNKNKYISYINTHAGEPFCKALIKLRVRIENEITLLLKTYTLLNDISKKELSIAELDTIYKPYSKIESFERSCIRLLKLQDTISSFNPKFSNNYNIDTLAYQANDLFKRLKTFLLKARLTEKDTANIDYTLFSNDDLFFVSRNAYQTLTKVALIANMDKNFYTSLDTIYRYIMYDHIRYIYKQIQIFNPALLYQKSRSFSDFVELLTKLNDLDKASSYESILKIIQNAGALYSTSSNIKTFNSLVNNIEKYTIINAAENRIYIDVESIILAIYNRYANKSDSWIDFYFSIGLNKSISIGNDFKYLSTDSLKSFGFAAEKIGLKIKLVNIKKMRQFELGEKRPRLFGGHKMVNKVQSKVPIISDIHLITYGTGLLYNIVDSKTSFSFDEYMIATGLGISFYNGFDLNISFNYPLVNNISFQDVISPNNSYQMLTFSFDVKIGEYLDALAQKANVSKTKQ